MTWHARQKLLGYIFIAPNMIGVFIFFLFPAIFSFGLAFTDWQFSTSSSFRIIGFDNFERLLHDDAFISALTNTLLFLISVPIAMALAFIIAVVLNNSVYMKNLLRTMYFLPYITSGVAVAFVWMILFEPNRGPINSFLKSIGMGSPPGWLSSTASAMYSIDIIWIWMLIGYNLIIYLAALQEISQELIEAAKMDGASPSYLVLKIIFPLVSPTTLLLFITGFISTIKQFGIIQAVTGGGPGDSTTVLSMYVYKTAFRYYEMGYASAVSWVLFLIVLVITLLQWIYQKKWVHY